MSFSTPPRDCAFFPGTSLPKNLDWESDVASSRLFPLANWTHCVPHARFFAIDSIINRVWHRH